MEKPKIKLSPLEKTAVRVPTQEEFDTLMRVYQLGGWLWMNDWNLPTELDRWGKYKEKTCVGAGTNIFSDSKGRFGYSDEESYAKRDWTRIFNKNFYKIQGLSSEQINEVNIYFDNLK